MTDSVTVPLGGWRSLLLPWTAGKVVLDQRGLTVVQREHRVRFTVRWDELERVQLARELRHYGAFAYDIELTPADPDGFAARHPELADWRTRFGYRYALGEIGWLGRRLEPGFERFGGQVWDGVRVVAG